MVRTYTVHDIVNGFNSLPSQVFVRQEDYDALSAVVHELRGYVEDLKRSRQAVAGYAPQENAQ